MSQLIKATITPFEAVHFRQNARLVSSGNIDAERRRVMAMQARFQLRYSGNGSVNTRDTSQIRRAFAKGQPQQLSKDAPKAEPVTTTPTEVQPKVSVPETENLTLSAPTAVSDYSAASGSSFSAENLCGTGAGNLRHAEDFVRLTGCKRRSLLCAGRRYDDCSPETRRVVRVYGRIQLCTAQLVACR